MNSLLSVAFILLVVAIASEAHFYPRHNWNMFRHQPNAFPAYRTNTRYHRRNSLPYQTGDFVPYNTRHSIQPQYHSGHSAQMMLHSNPMTGGHAPRFAGPSPMTGGHAPMFAGPSPMFGGPAPMFERPAQMSEGADQETQQLTGPRTDRFLGLLSSALVIQGGSPLLGSLGLLRAL